MLLLDGQLGFSPLPVIAMLVAIFLSLTGIMPLSSSNNGTGSSDSAVYAPVPTTAIINRTTDAILVNGIQIRQSIEEIRTQYSDFPETGVIVAQEDGRKRQQTDYQDATYYFDGSGILRRIGIKNTPEYISLNSHLNDAIKVYGNPLVTFCSYQPSDDDLLEDASDSSDSGCTGSSYSVFKDTLTAYAWVMKYSTDIDSQNKILEIFLEDDASKYQK